MDKLLRKPYLLIAIVAAALFIPFLGQIHLFDWDEINFAESAREMIVTGDYNTVRIDFEPFWEKPPIFIWMQVLSMKIFGVNEFAARFPNAICGIITLLFLFYAGRKLYNDRFAWLWVLSYAGSILPFFYFKSGIIDPWFNLFIFTGIYYSIRFVNRGEKAGHIFIALSATAIGLAVLTKGPVALLIWALCAAVYLVIKKFKAPIKWYHILEFLGIFALVGGSWFLVQILTGNSQTVVDFIVYQIRLFQTKDAGHGGFLLYHFVILLIGAFPASVFSLAAYRKNLQDNESQKDFKLWMIVLLWVVLILFTIVKTKIVHYSSMCYFPLTFLSAYVLYNYCFRNVKIQKWMHIFIIVIASVYTLVAGILASIPQYKYWIIENKLLNDPFALANLQADAGWTGFEPLIALIPLLIIGLAVYFYKKQKPLKYALSILVGVCLFTYITMMVLVKRVEAFSQRAAIEFFESKSNEDCYIFPLHYKSYAHYFYAKTKHPVNTGEAYLDEDGSPIPVYVSTKITEKDEVLEKYPSLEVLYEKNGFVFLKKKMDFITNK